MTTLPRFNFSKSTIKTTAELNKVVEETSGKQDRFFRPGKYEVKVIAAVHQGPAADKTWQKFLLTLKGAGPATITHQVMVPFESIEYNTSTGKNKLFAYSKLVKLMAGIGVALTPENLEATLMEYFSNVEKSLVGRQLSIDVGFRGNFIKYVGKNADGKTQYQICLSDQTLLPEVYADYGAAEAAAEVKKIEVSKFAEVTDITPSATGAATGTGGLKAANW